MNESTEVVIVLTTFSREEEAWRIARELVGRRLIACANLVPGGKSIYRWEGEIKEETEVMAFLKTTQECLDELALVLDELHSYKVPEFLVIQPTVGASSYLDFVTGQVKA